jgi:hypothetical protein
MATLEMAYDMMFDNMKQVASTENHSFYDIVFQALPITDQNHTTMTVWMAFCRRSLVMPEVARHQIETHSRWHSKVKNLPEIS